MDGQSVAYSHNRVLVRQTKKEQNTRTCTSQRWVLKTSVKLENVDTKERQLHVLGRVMEGTDKTVLS